MLRVFKKYLWYLIAGESIILMFVAALVHDHSSWLFPILLGLGASIVLFIILELKATSMHLRILGILYTWQKPQDFVQVYEPLSESKNLRKNLRFTMKVYVSNGYAAMGDFSNALKSLDQAPNITGKQAQKSKAIIHCNKCAIYLWSGETEKARQHYQALEKINMKSMESSTELLRLHLSLNEKQVTEEDADCLRSMLKATTSVFHKTELSYLLGDVYYLLGEREFAKSYFTDATQGGTQLLVSRLAQEKLSSLTTK